MEWKLLLSCAIDLVCLSVKKHSCVLLVPFSSEHQCLESFWKHTKKNWKFQCNFNRKSWHTLKIFSAEWKTLFCIFLFSPSGKLVQIEYALAAVAAGAPSVGIKGMSWKYFTDRFGILTVFWENETSLDHVLGPLYWIFLDLSFYYIFCYSCSGFFTGFNRFSISWGSFFWVILETFSW